MNGREMQMGMSILGHDYIPPPGTMWKFRPTAQSGRAYVRSAQNPERGKLVMICRRHASGRQFAWLPSPNRAGHNRAGTDNVLPALAMITSRIW
jgi:hypothetical protein